MSDARYPKKRLEWCAECGERYELRRGMKMEYVKGYAYSPDPHECPTVCKFCGAEHAVTRRGFTVTKDPHTCPGKEKADREAAEINKRYMVEMNRVFRRALTGR